MINHIPCPPGKNWRDCFAHVIYIGKLMICINKKPGATSWLNSEVSVHWDPD